MERFTILRNLGASQRRVVKGAIGATVVAYAAYVAYIAFGMDLGPTVDTIFTTWIFSGLVLSAGLICGLRALWVPEQRLAFGILGLGMVFWSAGALLWGVVYSGMAAPPYPSIADLCYLLFYPCAYVSLMLIARSRVRGFVASVWLDGAIGVLAIGAVGAAFVVPEVADT